MLLTNEPDTSLLLDVDLEASFLQLCRCRVPIVVLMVTDLVRCGSCLIPRWTSKWLAIARTTLLTVELLGTVLLGRHCVPMWLMSVVTGQFLMRLEVLRVRADAALTAVTTRLQIPGSMGTNMLEVPAYAVMGLGAL